MGTEISFLDDKADGLLQYRLIMHGVVPPPAISLQGIMLNYGSFHHPPLHHHYDGVHYHDHHSYSHIIIIIIIIRFSSYLTTLHVAQCEFFRNTCLTISVSKTS
jgi:hypothetical protein